MGNNASEELKELRLDLIDLVSPYGVSGKDTLPFDEELVALADLPSKQRDNQLKELAAKICKYYKKTKRVK